MIFSYSISFCLHCSGTRVLIGKELSRKEPYDLVNIDDVGLDRIIKRGSCELKKFFHQMVSEKFQESW